MPDIEINGRKVLAPEGSTVMEAAQHAGIYIPHFCYHKKLSIAANCRMCLVEVEKAPKPLPACATPVTSGMRVFTHSQLALSAQKGVMEFLLINHPLDCPICDQGGECLLQDLAVGYGGTASRFREKKHVTAPKEAGPLVSMREMSRCIHCTRCVRFGQEIAGFMELGMTGRNLHTEITTFLGHAIESELSGNLIDICPVGALTSKPFRYTARAWEMTSHRSVSPHDSLGANLLLQTRSGRLMRVLPADNEAVNECWLSDKERFSYTALASGRLEKPLLKQGGTWREVDWASAIDYVAHGLADIAKTQGPDALAALIAPHATVEEMYLLQKLLRGLGSGNVDYRLRQQDFSADGQTEGVAWLGMPIADLRHLDATLVVGSFLRKDHPLMAQRLRHAAQKHHAAINLLSVTMDDPHLPLHSQWAVLPAQLSDALAAVLKAAIAKKGVTLVGPLGDSLARVTVTPEAARMADDLISHDNTAVLLGKVAAQLPDAGRIRALAAELAALTGSTLGFLGEAANSAGGEILGLGRTGANTRQMLETPRGAYLLFNLEPELDCGNPSAALQALQAARMVVSFSSFSHAPTLDYADAILPLAAFAETSGTYINAEGRVQSFQGALPPPGDARPGWKILRVIGSALALPGFDFEDSAAVRTAALHGRPAMQGDAEFILNRNNALSPAAQNSLLAGTANTTGRERLTRIADVPIHFTDPVARRAPPLQQTADSAPPVARMAAKTAERLGLVPGELVRLRQDTGTDAVLPLLLDDTVPTGGVRVAAGHAATASLGGMFDAITVEKT
jgi:NADH-quinone oxidoreductase subunit G